MRILCFGDSNTYGYDPRGFFGGRYDSEDRWVDLLTQQTGHEIINLGANGREIPRNPYALRLLTEHAPVDFFLVMLGTNDLLQGASAEAAAAQMEHFLTPLLPHCNRILLISPPPMNRGAWVPTDKLVIESIRLAEEYRAVASHLNIPFRLAHRTHLRRRPLYRSRTPHLCSPPEKTSARTAIFLLTLTLRHSL